jgi:hypothetical protein
MFTSGRVFHNSLFHLCARHFTRNDLNHAYQQFFLVFLVLSPLYMVTEQDRRNLSLSLCALKMLPNPEKPEFLVRLIP